MKQYLFRATLTLVVGFAVAMPAEAVESAPAAAPTKAAVPAKPTAQAKPAAPKGAPAAAPRTYPVMYNPAKDQLTVAVANKPLREILIEVMRLSSLEVRLDPAVNPNVTASFRDLPLDEGLQRITGKLNTIKSFKKQGTGAKARNVLVSVVILPEGSTDAGRAARVIDYEKEVANQASNVVRFKKQQDNAAIQRWNLRVDSLPPAFRKAYEKQKQRQEEMEARMAANNERLRSAAEERRGKGEKSQQQFEGTMSKRKPLPPEEKSKWREMAAPPETPPVVDAPGN